MNKMFTPIENELFKLQDYHFSLDYGFIHEKNA